MNLISAGLIKVQQLRVNQVRREVANLLQVSVHDIERVEFWAHQLWVKVTGVRATFVSYRRLPSWIPLVFNVISNAASLEELEDIGNIINDEKQNFCYQSEDLQNLRYAYAKRRSYLRKLLPMIKHQRLGKSWLEHWRSILQYCQNSSSLEYLSREIKAQSKQFADLPEVMASLNRIWRDRCQELAATG